MGENLISKQYLGLSPILVIVILLLVTCDKDPYKPETRIFPIESPILVEVYEGYYKSDSIGYPFPKLYSKTELIYPYLNCELTTEYNYQDSILHVNYINVFVYDVSVPGSGPATSETDLHFLENELNLSLNFEEYSDLYRITMTDTTISIFAESTSFSSPITNLYWRYKENSFVYLFKRIGRGYSYHYEEFINVVDDEIELVEFSYPDSGKIPYWQVEDWGEYPQTPPRFFTYESDEDFIQIGEILETYTLANIPWEANVRIKLINWKNDWHYSALYYWLD
jgi:hypothetical protein